MVFRPRKLGTKPVVMGTGLVALDAVVSADSSVPVRYWAGGTCGNVLIALKYLGWAARPVARLANDAATELLLSDLRRWKVSERFVRIEADGSTPVIFEHITKDGAGPASHRFSWRCPECGARFPSYKAELVSIAEAIVPRIRNIAVFFFDRASPAALVLARAAAEAGALVMFEPSGTGNPVLFHQAWELAHVVKYSHERLAEFPEMDVEDRPRLTIETLGQSGLRYRWRRAKSRFSAWVERKALPVGDLRDAAGAGDWCTAGLLSRLAPGAYAGFSMATDQEVAEAIRFGQALAAWSCRFEGPRGGMYAVTKRQFQKQVDDILSGAANVIPMPAGAAPEASKANVFCRVCEQTASHSRSRSKAR